MFKNKLLQNYEQSMQFFIPFGALVDEDGNSESENPKYIVVNKNLSYSMCLKIRFLDLDYFTEEEKSSKLKIFNNLIKRLPEGFVIHSEFQRKKINDNRKKRNYDKIPAFLIENRRKEIFSADNFYKTEYYITLSYFIQNDLSRNIFETIIERKDEEETAETFLYMKRLQEFKEGVADFIEQLRSVSLEIEILSDEKLMGYLYSTVNQKFIEKLEFTPDILLDSQLSKSTYTFGKYPQVGDKYLATLTLTAFPEAIKDRIFQDLEKLNFEFRFCSRYVVLDREESKKLIEKFRDFHRGKKFTFLQYFTSAINKKESSNPDEYAILKANEANNALTELKTGFLEYGIYTITIIVTAYTKNELEEHIKDINKILAALDFTTAVDKYNTLDSIVGAIPGQVSSNIRRMPINSMLFTGLSPVSSIFQGFETNDYLRDESLMVARTSSRDIFHLNLHVGDVGHTFIVGPTGSGKSVLIGMIVVEFTKYNNSQVFIFDKGRSSKILTTLCGGDFFDLGNYDLSFQPLADIHLNSEKEFARDWLINIFESENIIITPALKEKIWKALTNLSTNDREDRTIERFHSHLQDEELKQAIWQYTKYGPYGQFFDNNTDNFSSNSFISFEMGDVMEQPKVAPHILDYMFHRLERDKFKKGKKTLLVLDEAWVFIDNAQMRGKIRDWLKTLRKLGVAVLFATQSLDDIINSNIASAIIDACKTKILLPNEYAKTSWSELYMKLGLNSQEIEDINDAQQKQDYFYKSTKGARMFQLELSELELALVGSTDKADFDKIDELKKKYGNDLKMLNLSWLDWKLSHLNIETEKEMIRKNY